jgi:hypothetical protein
VRRTLSRSQAAALILLRENDHRRSSSCPSRSMIWPDGHLEPFPVLNYFNGCRSRQGVTATDHTTRADNPSTRDKMKGASWERGSVWRPMVFINL